MVRSPVRVKVLITLRQEVISLAEGINGVAVFGSRRMAGILFLCLYSVWGSNYTHVPTWWGKKVTERLGRGHTQTSAADPGNEAVFAKGPVPSHLPF